MLSVDPSLQLAFSLFENKGVLAILIGSGLSRAAKIPTGWEITIDLIRRVAVTNGETEQADWAAWYRETTHSEPNYSALLADLAGSPEERRAILHRYIEPTEEEREEGAKQPTVAHRAIAQLVRGGYVRVIVTTNFDRLMENALREIGVEPTVVASIDALKGAEPPTHSSCYILKLHGDYKDARILNTDEELSSYSPEYDRLLDKIFDEYGLIVCGWSGEWDHALRAAMLRAPNRRYPVFWATRGQLGSGAEELVRQRDARVITVDGADEFFSNVLQRVQTLELTQRHNPQGLELAVASTKRFLSKPEHRIALDELINEEAERLAAELDNANMPAQGHFDATEFRRRVARYEAATEAMACMAGVIGRWGEGTLPLVLNVLEHLLAHSRRERGGLIIYLELRSYPAALVFTCFALGLVRAQRWRDLHDLFSMTVDDDNGKPRRMVELLFLSTGRGSSSDMWKQLDGFDRRKTPLSDHLLDVVGLWSKRFMGLTPELDLQFELFELLGSIAHVEIEGAQNIRAAIDQAARGFLWMPVGRIGWDRSNAERIKSRLGEKTYQDALLAAGFAGGNKELFDLAIENFERISDRMSWM